MLLLVGARLSRPELAKLEIRVRSLANSIGLFWTFPRRRTDSEERLQKLIEGLQEVMGEWEKLAGRRVFEFLDGKEPLKPEK